MCRNAERKARQDAVHSSDNLPAGIVSQYDAAIHEIPQRTVTKVAKNGLDPKQAVADAEAEAIKQFSDLTRA